MAFSGQRVKTVLCLPEVACDPGRHPRSQLCALSGLSPWVLRLKIHHVRRLSTLETAVRGTCPSNPVHRSTAEVVEGTNCLPSKAPRSHGEIRRAHTR